MFCKGIEILANAIIINNSDQRMGIQLTQKTIKIAQYAEDTIAFSKGVNSLNVLFRIFNINTSNSSH